MVVFGHPCFLDHLELIISLAECRNSAQRVPCRSCYLIFKRLTPNGLQYIASGTLGDCYHLEVLESVSKLCFSTLFVA
jgi:hypothetical protein